MDVHMQKDAAYESDEDFLTCEYEQDYYDDVIAVDEDATEYEIFCAQHDIYGAKRHALTKLIRSNIVPVNFSGRVEADEVGNTLLEGLDVLKMFSWKIDGREVKGNEFLVNQCFVNTIDRERLDYYFPTRLLLQYIKPWTDGERIFQLGVRNDGVDAIQWYWIHTEQDLYCYRSNCYGGYNVYYDGVNYILDHYSYRLRLDGELREYRVEPWVMASSYVHDPDSRGYICCISGEIYHVPYNKKIANYSQFTSYKYTRLESTTVLVDGELMGLNEISRPVWHDPTAIEIGAKHNYRYCMHSTCMSCFNILHETRSRKLSRDTVDWRCFEINVSFEIGPNPALVALNKSTIDDNIRRKSHEIMHSHAINKVRLLLNLYYYAQVFTELDPILMHEAVIVSGWYSDQDSLISNNIADVYARLNDSWYVDKMGMNETSTIKGRLSNAFVLQEVMKMNLVTCTNQTRGRRGSILYTNTK